MQVDREGRFKATITDWSVGESKNGAPQFAMELAITMFWSNGEWIPWADYGHDITYYGYLFKKDGEPNTITLDALKDALGWDGTSMAGLQAMDLAGKLVQITVKSENYEGKDRMKVGFLYPGDAEPGLRKLTDTETRNLANKWDMKLRALAGPAKPAAAKPTSPVPATNGTPKPPAAPPKRPGADVDVARSKAWDTFTTAAPSDISQDDLSARWHAAIEETFPGKSQDKLSAGDWLLLTDRVHDFFESQVPEFADAASGPQKLPF